MILEEIYLEAARHLALDNAEQAVELLLPACAEFEVAPARLAALLARSYSQLADDDQCMHWARVVVEDPWDYASWQATSRLLPERFQVGVSGVRRTLKLAIIGSSTTLHYTPLLRLAAFRYGMGLEVLEAPYGQVSQQLLDPGSDTYRFQPNVILLATHADAVRFNGYTADYQSVLEQEVEHWTSLHRAAAANSTAGLVQFNFALPPDDPMGHVAPKMTGSRSWMLRELNQSLARLDDSPTMVDVDGVSSRIGKDRWFDPRYWHFAKEAVAPDCLPTLARHTCAVIGAVAGLARKCIILDLDNTLWGGVIGEDGLEGIQLGQGAVGEAFVAFQEYLLQLKQKGLILGVCSKNNEEDAIEVFASHPEMRLKLDDIAIFVANWNPKADNIRHIAETLNLGLDAFVFVDDNPAERQIVRSLLPEVEVIQLPEDPAYFVRALAQCHFLETRPPTAEDQSRTEQYRARAQAMKLQESSPTLEDFLADLDMKAVVRPFDDVSVPRIVQLLGKTNQFNLTTKRHSEFAVRQFMSDPNVITMSVRLTDRFADHGLVALMIVQKKDSVLDIDSWLMSCRVIGRGVEDLMFELIRQRARNLGCQIIRGEYRPTQKNAPVRDLYQRLGFRRRFTEADDNMWELDLTAGYSSLQSYIEVLPIETDNTE